MSGENKINGPLDHPVIAEVTESFRRRRRSLRTRFAVVELRRVIERNDGVESELVEILLRRRESPKSVTVRLKIWQDRIARIDVWNMAGDAGPTSWSREGRFAGSTLGKPLMDALDETDVVLGQPTLGETLDGIWSRLLLTGPATLVQPLP